MFYFPVQLYAIKRQGLSSILLFSSQNVLNLNNINSTNLSTISFVFFFFHSSLPVFSSFPSFPFQQYIDPMFTALREQCDMIQKQKLLGLTGFPKAESLNQKPQN